MAAITSAKRICGASVRDTSLASGSGAGGSAPPGSRRAAACRPPAAPSARRPGHFRPAYPARGLHRQPGRAPLGRHAGAGDDAHMRHGIDGDAEGKLARLALSANTTRSAPRKGTGRRTANRAGRSMVTAAAPRLKRWWSRAATVRRQRPAPAPARCRRGAGERRGPSATGPGRGRALAPKLGVRQGCHTDQRGGAHARDDRRGRCASAAPG